MLNCEHHNLDIQQTDSGKVNMHCRDCFIDLSYASSGEFNNMRFNDIHITETFHVKVDKISHAFADSILKSYMEEFKKQGGFVHPQWKPLNTLAGKLSQICNIMTAFDLQLVRNPEEIKE
jgi:tRNA A-37 threonylcarbamoyl transferase component Bud32